MLDDRVALSPLNTDLGLELHIDASKEVIGYALTQPYCEIGMDVKTKKRHIIAL